MTSMVGDYINRFVVVFLDNILVYSKSADERVDPDKVSAVANWAAPRDVKGV